MDSLDDCFKKSEVILMIQRYMRGNFGAHYPESGYTFATIINTNFSSEEAWTIWNKIMPVVLNIRTPIIDSSQINNIALYTENMLQSIVGDMIMLQQDWYLKRKEK